MLVEFLIGCLIHISVEYIRTPSYPVPCTCLGPVQCDYAIREWQSSKRGHS